MSGSSTFSSAVARGKSWKLWKTKPISRLRTSASSSSERSLTSRPESRYRPEVGTSRQPTMFIRVDFPEPDCPTMATNSLRSMRTSMLRRAGTFWCPRSYVLTIFSSSISAMCSPGVAAATALLATAALRALLFSRLARLLHLDALPFLQLAGERAVGPVDHGLAVLDPLQDLDVRPAGDARAHFPHLRFAVLDHENDLHRLGLPRRGGRGRSVGRVGGGAAGHGRDQRAFARGRLLLLLLRLAAGDRLDGHAHHGVVGGHRDGDRRGHARQRRLGRLGEGDAH